MATQQPHTFPVPIKSHLIPLYKRYPAAPQSVAFPAAVCHPVGLLFFAHGLSGWRVGAGPGCGFKPGVVFLGDTCSCFFSEIFFVILFSFASCFFFLFTLGFLFPLSLFLRFWTLILSFLFSCSLISRFLLKSFSLFNISLSSSSLYPLNHVISPVPRFLDISITKFVTTSFNFPFSSIY